jgi:hypothetical protein
VHHGGGVLDRNRIRTRRALGTILLMLSAAGCRLYYDCITRPGSVTKLVADSVEVRRLLAGAAGREAQAERSRRELSNDQQVQLMNDMEARPERYMAERRKFLDSMGRQPGVFVAGEQYFRILEQSPAGCADDPVTTSNYLRVRVTTGPSKGSEGWACSRDVQPIGAWVL